MMPQPHFSVSWNEHPKNITTGLSSLQQNSEFVDMTLAADGHFVKVHQVLMALSSPYIKDLISSTQCKHPVIFLNKVSYTTLTAILQYIYTGEVLVGFEDLRNLIDAAQELHIKGLQDMDLTRVAPQKKQKAATQLDNTNVSASPTKIFFDSPQLMSKYEVEEMQDVQYLDDPMETLSDTKESIYTTATSYVTESHPSKNSKGSREGPLQYTVSNQGSIQMVFNQFLYYLKYTNRDRMRQWRCVEYVNKNHCPAAVATKNDVVLQRFSAHNHPNHDKRIFKKLKDGILFSTIHEAEAKGMNIKKKKR